MSTALSFPLSLLSAMVAISKALPIRSWQWTPPLLLCPMLAFSQLQLIKDINPGSAGSYPVEFTRANGINYFYASDNLHGDELWRSDGTTAGTTLIKDVRPGADGSSAYERQLTSANGLLYFVANDGVHGEELWKSDGTSAGTMLVKDIYPGYNYSEISHLTPCGDKLYFWANDGTHGFELWQSDGTEQGTVLFKDMQPGPADGQITAIKSAGNFLYYTLYEADGAGYKFTLWKSDGTAQGTTQINKDFPGNFVVLNEVNGLLYFVVYRGASQPSELWKSDGTDAGTVLVTNRLYFDDTNVYFTTFTPVNGVFYFSAANTLWKSDGTDAGTVAIAQPGHASNLTSVNGTLYFTTSSSLWKSDGTAAGTTSIKYLGSIPVGSNPQSFFNAHGVLYFIASSGANGEELWKSDGTGPGTQLVTDVSDGDGSYKYGTTILHYADNTLFIRSNNNVAGDDELWKYTPGTIPPCTASGTILREYWANVPGHNTKDIPLNTPPTFSDQLTVFRTRANVDDHYGQRIRGYICAPTTGNYTFFVQGDDVAELYLSSDNNPAHKQLIASAKVAWSWTDKPSQHSMPVSLVAGQSYYVEVLHKEGAGGDVMRVGWRTPSMAAQDEPVIIPGSVLSPFVISGSTREELNEQASNEILTHGLTASPNPFSEQVTIAFTTDQTEPARLQVYDLQGRLVEQLYEGLSQAGEEHQLSFNGSRLIQGLYLIRLATARKVSHYKLLLNK